MADIRATKTMYATADGKLVDEGDPNAAFLVAREGARVSADVVKQYGLKGAEYDESAVLEEQEQARRATLSAPSHGQMPTREMKPEAAAEVREGTALPQAEEQATDEPTRRRR